jgi:hypothetical protein
MIKFATGAPVLSKLEIYGIALLVLIAVITAGYLKGRTDERKILTGEAAAQLAAANQKTETLNGQLVQSELSHTQSLAALDKDHADALAAALASIKPVIVRVPVAGSGQVPAASGSANATATAGQSNVPVPVGRDISRPLVVQAGECQQERDSLDTYVAFYEDLRARINAR